MPHESITEREAVRAIYVDFEGCKFEAPSLLGYLVDGRLEQVVLDRRLTAAASFRGLMVLPGAQVMSSLVSRCEREGRVIVGFTQHEPEVALEYFGADLRPHYRNAHRFAKRFFRRLPAGERPVGWSLEEMLVQIGCKRPRAFGPGNSASRLRDVREMLAKRQSYQRLTPVAKAKWTKFLARNAGDVKGTELLVRHVLRG
jgi:hypothetical protein